MVQVALHDDTPNHARSPAEEERAQRRIGVLFGRTGASSGASASLSNARGNSSCIGLNSPQIATSGRIAIHRPGSREDVRQDAEDAALAGMGKNAVRVSVFLRPDVNV